MKFGREMKSPGISTMAVVILVVVIVVIAGVGVYFATSTSSSTTATTSTSSLKTATTSLTTVTASTTRTTSSSSSTLTVDITIPSGAGNASHPNNFIPNTVAVLAGTTIVFINNDTTTHDIDFTSVPSGVTISPNPSPNTPQWTNNKFSVTLTVPGTYVYICDYHAWMTGVIQVN
jgi:plastocyanin